jgi:hypothetical protein
MAKRLQLSLHIALTIIAFATTGRPPRLVAHGPRDLATVEERLTTMLDETFA